MRVHLSMCVPAGLYALQGVIVGLATVSHIELKVAGGACSQLLLPTDDGASSSQQAGAGGVHLHASHWEALQWLAAQGFDVSSESQVHGSWQEALQAATLWRGRRDMLGGWTHCCRVGRVQVATGLLAPSTGCVLAFCAKLADAGTRSVIAAAHLNVRAMPPPHRHLLHALAYNQPRWRHHTWWCVQPPLFPIAQSLHTHPPTHPCCTLPAPADYQTDGVVFKLDSTELQRALGDNGVDPRWAIAWKFLSEIATTEVVVGGWRGAALQLQSSCWPVPLVAGARRYCGQRMHQCCSRGSRCCLCVAVGRSRMRHMLHSISI